MAGSSGDREYACSVPVYSGVLAMLSEDVDTLLEMRWARQEEEYKWETKAVAAAEHPVDDDYDYGYRYAAPDAATKRQLGLAYQLSSLVSWLECFFESILRSNGDQLSRAVDPWRRPEHWPRRPHPGTAAWWHQRGHPGGLMFTRFVQVSWEEVARAQELVDDAYDRALRLTALAEDMNRECCGLVSADAAVVLSTPQLLERLRRAQRLADDILVPLHPLKRLLDQLSGADEPRRRRKRGRGRSASPPRAAAASTRSIRRRSIE